MFYDLKMGALVRSFAKSNTQVTEVVARAVATAAKLRNLKFGDSYIFADILFVVPTDFDCGKTAEALRKEFTAPGYYRVRVLETKGHHSCGALNKGVHKLKTLGMQYVVILSNKAVDYVDGTTMDKVENALGKGMDVVGVSIPGLSDIAENPIQNTFAAWNIGTLLSVGGFDCETGVEEVAPIVHIMQKSGTTVGLIKGQRDAKLNIRQSADGQARHEEVKNTKQLRQEEEAVRLGVTLDWVKNNIVQL